MRRGSPGLGHGGKEEDGFMQRVVYSSLGSASRKVLVGPARGFDNGVVSMGRNQVMIVTVDPVSAVPAFGMRLSAKLSVHLIASDFTAAGVDPQFAVFAYNFPPEMKSPQREEYVKSVGDECRRLGIAIAAGHTGSYPGGGFTVIGSGAMFGASTEGGYVTSAMAREGDSVLMTKHAAIEATMTLAMSFPTFLGEKLGPGVVRRGGAMSKICTTVEDARAARGAGLGPGGVTSMHDATEGGILGALDEMADASKKAFMVNVEKIPVEVEAKEICGAFGINPLSTMGEGALLITCSRGRTGELRELLGRAGIAATEVGSVVRGRGLWLVRGGRSKRFHHPGRDRFWGAYDLAVQRGLE